MKAFGSFANRSIRVLSPRILPPLTLLEGSTASTATRRPAAVRRSPERLDERALSCTRNTANTDAVRAAGVRQQLNEQSLRLHFMIRAPALDERDGSGEGGAVARSDVTGQFVHHRRAASTASKRSHAASAITVPGG